MRHPYLKWIAASALFAACSGALADSLQDEYRKVKSEGEVSYFIDIDNDTLLLNHSDKFYTSGARYNQAYTLEEEARATTFGWRIGQDLYTASDIKLPPALVKPPDHPYAGWLYGGFFKEVDYIDGRHIGMGIDIGCLGPCAGGNPTQTNLHRLLRQPLPQGWSKQVKNEPGLVLYADVAPARWALAQSVDARPYLTARFGNIFTDAAAGLTLRAGRLNFLPRQSTFHGFARVEARAVGYNATLQGGYFSNDNPHTVAPRRLVGEAEVGVIWRRGKFGASAGVIHRGSEIRDLSNALGAQDFLRLQLSYTP